MKDKYSNTERPRILFISRELISGDLALTLKREGCDVKLFIEDQGQKECLDGLVEKTSNWENELDWVGKDGLIIFDDVGYGKTQDDLRKSGHIVFGGGHEGERLEADRMYAQELFLKTGVAKEDFQTKDFMLESAINFIKENKGTWVAKQTGHDTTLSYVGILEDGSDMISVLEDYKKKLGGSHRVSLQKKVFGVEIAIGRFFNGKDWVGPSVINFEHKHLGNDDIGPLGGESGTLMWYDDNENNKLFQRTLKKIECHLRTIDYKGYIDINCIVNQNNVYPLEITARFGSSTIETQEEIHISPWNEFFFAIAKGENYKLKYKKGYALNVAMTVSPFPYRTTDKGMLGDNLNIFFSKISPDDFKHIRLEGVSLQKTNEEKYYTSGNLGYVLYVTSISKMIENSRKKVYSLVSKIIIPKSFYRTDIGVRFIKKDKALLKKWGWI